MNTTTGDQITFTDLVFDDVTFTIDANADQPFSPESGPWYAADMAFTNAAQWFTLAVGANTWTAPGSTAVTLTWHDREEF